MLQRTKNRALTRTDFDKIHKKGDFNKYLDGGGRVWDNVNPTNQKIDEALPTKTVDPKEFPNPLSDKKGFLKKGTTDGDKTDDIVNTKPVNISVSKLKPSQAAIYLGKALAMAMNGVEGGDLGAVISKDNYILDGHHRYAATMFNNPNASVGGVQSDLIIGDLIPVLRAVGDAMKNKRGIAPAGGDISVFAATMDDVKDIVFKGKNVPSQYYDAEKAKAWFEKIGEDTIAKRLKMIQASKPPSGAPARKDMPKITPAQVNIVKTLLNKGKIDVKEPYANESKVSTSIVNKIIKEELESFMNKLNSVNEVTTTPVSGTKAGSTTSLDNRKYILKKDVKGAQIGDFVNVVLPKGTIIWNLPGGVFADHSSLKQKYTNTYSSNSPRWDNKFGVSIRQMPETLKQIEKNSIVKENMNEATVKIKAFGDTTELDVKVYKDKTGHPYVSLYEDGEPYADITVILPETKDLPKDEFYAKGWSENKEIVLQLIKAKVLIPTAKKANTGRVVAHSFKLNSRYK